VRVRRFDNFPLFVEEAAGLIASEMFAGSGRRMIVLPGGRTPEPVYERLRLFERRADDNVVIALSDERMAPADSRDINFRLLEPLILSLGIPLSRVLSPLAGVPPAEAARRLHHEVAGFLDAGGRLPLAALGLGADGHTAGLYKREIASADDGTFAVVVQRPDGRLGVTLTRSLFKRFERVIFLVSGRSKSRIVERIETDPMSVAAYHAMVGAPSVEVWFCKTDVQG